MKLQAHGNKLETNVENESQDFSIGEIGTIIEILRNRLYTNKIATPVQEYISNAKDACHEAKKKDNDFSITIPTRLNPVFSVRDKGIGLTPERVKNIFIRYGSSTKRQDNEMIGGFGLGSKSFWAYQDSFSVITYLDGIRRSYVAHIGTTNQGKLDLVSTDETTEENGTEVSVAVRAHDIEEFRKAVFRCIYFWEEKPLLKGELEPPTLIKGIQVSDLLEVINNDLLPEYVRPDDYSIDMIACIDGIPYPLNDKIINKIKPLQELKNICSGRIILHFGNGLVEVAASRESIADSKHTVAALEKMAQKALLEVKTYIADRFGKVKTTQEYIETYVGMSDLFEVDQFAKYGEYEIKNSAITSTLLKKTRMTLIHSYDKRHRNKINKITKDILRENQKDVEISRFGHLFYRVVNESPMVQNKRIREYLKTNNWIILIEQLDTTIAKVDKVTNDVLRDKDGKTILENVSYPNEFKQVIKDLSVKDFTTITYIDPPKAPRGLKGTVTRANDDLCLHPPMGDAIHTTLATNTQKWIFVRLDGSTWPSKYSRQMLQDLDRYVRYNDNIKVCGVSAKAYEVAKNDPNFENIEDYLKSYKPSKDVLLFVKNCISKNDNSVTNLDRMNGIKDKFVLKMLDEYKIINKRKTHNLPEILRDKVKEIYKKEIEVFKTNDKNFGALMEKRYPLINECGWSQHKSELVIYMNHKYESRKKNV